MKDLFWFWLPPLGYMAAIFFVSSLSHPEVVGGEIPDYILHTIEYFLLALLFIRLLLARPTLPVLKGGWGTLLTWHRRCLLGVLITILYGASDEFHQYFVPNRQCTLQDLLADAGGALLAYGIAALDYFLLKYCRPWVTFLKRWKLADTMSYATSWIKLK